ncbi:MAG: hypothetical protein RLZ39_757 [Bacteroidota bacterium]|jgi:hypothetical protein
MWVLIMFKINHFMRVSLANYKNLKQGYNLIINILNHNKKKF